MRGHLEHDEITAAFSKDIGSAGKPSFFQAAFLASVVRIFKGSIPSVMGIYLATISGSHMFFHKSSLNLAEKAPI